MAITLWHSLTTVWAVQYLASDIKPIFTHMLMRGVHMNKKRAKTVNTFFH